MSPLIARALQLAIGEVGVREQPPGSNRGPQVDQYLRSTGLDPAAGAYPWCAAFLFWCFESASKALAERNPMPCTASAMRLVERAAWARVTSPAAGCVFVIDHGGGRGHAGLVERVTAGDPTELITVEGNTNPWGRRDGDGVYERTRRPAEVFAFLDFGVNERATT